MGQMIEDVKLALECKKNVEFFGRTGGIIPKPAEILAKIVEMTQKGAK
ncbi:MAG: 3-methyl-2-oxobutanoate dehydrogenase subunit beta, partial [Ruminococcaceae bacterium]|nr:3-methyl-2-oxobutanoate dehydrogenase subunit beta [Oscillospiraceae bacterium]